jgi:hypothetical protein
MKNLSLSFVITLLSGTLFSQNTIICRGVIVGSDTIPVVNLSEVVVSSDMVFKDKKQYEQWTRIKYGVKKVYPYAIIASAKLKEYEIKLSNMTDESQKKSYLKICEKDLRSGFENDLKSLSNFQGRILMKLIYRETNRTTYDIVKELRGTFQAIVWQGVARLFGNNMKESYDKNQEDIMIEKAIVLVENGYF